MCVRPIQINKTRPDGSVETRVVPCGKCPECLAKARNEVAALSCLEGIDKSSLSFMTMTYRPDKLPISFISDDESGIPRMIAVGRSRCDDYNGYWKESCRVVDIGNGLSVCPTLYREDWKAHMKRFRAAVKRKELSTEFSMLCFGEYGDKRSRPHYHALFFGLTPAHEKIFTELWERYYGQCKTISVPRFNQDGSDAFMRVSKYISKYISKGSHLPEACKNGLIEKPRRLSSIGFGRSDLDFLRLRNFI